MAEMVGNFSKRLEPYGVKVGCGAGWNWPVLGGTGRYWMVLDCGVSCVGVGAGQLACLLPFGHHGEGGLHHC